jgi:predicted MFS family arabinose efflux permease
MIREKLKSRTTFLPLIFLFALVIFFWTLFDSILMYIVPLLMEKNSFSISLIGLIIGTSSISGALFDFFICKFLKNSNFRRVFLAMFVICFFYPIILWQANTIWLFLFAMAIWGIYFDMYNFGAFNFVGHYAEKEEHASSFGIIQIFRALGWIIAPIITGLVIAKTIDWQIFVISWFFLGVGFIFFILLLFLMRKQNTPDKVQCHIKRNKDFFREINLWKKLGKAMTPVLSVTFFLSLTESFFWTLSPLYAESTHFEKFGGLFLTAYVLPALFVGWLVKSFTNKFGKKKTALVGILIGSIILSFFVYVTNPIASIVLVFFASCFISIALPAINGAYADYISESPQVDSEIEGVEDFSFNFGYVVGPILAGLLADTINIPTAFTSLGLIGIVLAVILLLITPKNIVITVFKREL